MTNSLRNSTISGRISGGQGSWPGGVEAGVALGIGVVSFMVFPRMAIPVRSHLIEYSVMAVFVDEAFSERTRHGRPVPVPAMLAILLTSLIGAIDEFIQLILPSRTFAWEDIEFNALASVMAVVGMVTLRWARRWSGRGGR